MRLTLVLLLALTVSPISAFAYGNKTVIEVYQEAIQKLDLEYEKLKQLTAEAKQKVADLEKDANSIKTLIADYQKALKTTTQALEKKHEAELKVVKDAYRTELAVEAKLAELARHSAEDNDKATRALLDKLGTSADKVAKLTDALSVSSEGKVGIGTTTPDAKLDVRGGIYAGNSDIYFTKTDHNHIGIGNTTGFAAIENAANFGALMILGRAGTSKGRYVRLWDYLQVNGSLDVTGKVGIGTTNPTAKLEVIGTTHTQKLQLGQKWLLSGVGNDDWLRLYGIKGAGYYGGFAAEKLWTNEGAVQGSDARFKREVETLDNPLSQLLSLRGVRFKWKDSEHDSPQLGVIAQEIEKVFPEIIEMGPNNMKGVNYSGLMAILIEAIKAQQRQIEQLKKMRQ
jgi:hypothetical protein